MLGRIAVLAASVALVACAGVEPVGRNSGRTASAPPPVARTTAPPAQRTTAPPPQQTAAAPAQTTPPAQTTTAPSRAPALTVPPEATSPARTASAAPPAQTTPPPSVAAPAVTAPPAAPQRAASATADDSIVVPGQREQQVRPPAGDPRSVSQRMEDVRAWDQCVTRVQAAFEGDPMRPQLTTPEEYCRQSLGMASRLAVPESRRQRQR